MSLSACTDKADVYHEAMVFYRLYHLYFGMCTESSPYRLDMQFHGVGLQTVTLSKEMLKKVIIGPAACLIVC